MRFSSRTAWPTEENALARRAPGRVRWDLTRTNPTELGLSPALGDRLQLPGVDRYIPDARGLVAAREAIVEYHARHGAQLDAERVILLSGTSEGYSHAFHVLADPGDQILVPAPGYPLFSFLADLAGIELVPYPLAYDGAWHIDWPRLLASLGPKVRAVVVVSPNNPTGSYTSHEELTRLVELSATRGIAILSDEVFYDHSLLRSGPAGPSAATATSGLVLTLSGLSKLCALPQMKLAWMLVGGAETLAAEAMRRLEIVADTFLSVSTPAQVALPTLLELAPAVAARTTQRARVNLGVLRRALEGSAASVLRVEGGWSVMLRLPATRSDEAWALSLLDAGVLVQPGHFFDASGGPFVVVSLIVDEDTLRTGAEVLSRVIADG